LSSLFTGIEQTNMIVLRVLRVPVDNRHQTGKAPPHAHTTDRVAMRNRDRRSDTEEQQDESYGLVERWRSGPPATLTHPGFLK
jgi:hypothetical protein